MKTFIHIALCLLIIIGASASTHASEQVTVISDQGHGQRFFFGSLGGLHLSKLSRLFEAEGFHVMIAPGGATPHMLSYADVFVISGPFRPFTRQEAETLYGFVSDGGRLAIMTHITPTLFELFDKFGITSSDGVIKEREGVIGGVNTDFLVSVLKDHPLMQGIESFSAYGAWGLGSSREGMEVIASTSTRAWEDLDTDDLKGTDEKAGPFGIVVAGLVGKGKVVVFGDDAIFQNKFLEGNNLRLAENLIRWLKE